MMDKMKHLRRMPQNYKNLDLYPIKLFDYDIYVKFLNIFSIPKDYIYEKEIIKMSYLKYLLLPMQSIIDNNFGEGGLNIQSEIENILSYITKKNVFITREIKECPIKGIDVDFVIYIDKTPYSEADFNDIRKIILEQNGTNIEYVESYHPELEVNLQVHLSQHKNVPFYDKILNYLSITGKDIEDMADWTVDEFINKYNKLNEYELWKILLPLSYQQSIKADPRDIDSPFGANQNSKDRYSSILISEDEMKKNDIFKVSKQL